MKRSLYLILILACYGCQNDKEFILKGYHTDLTYEEMKSKYDKDKDVKVAGDVIDDLENMLVLAKSKDQTDWVTKKLFTLLEDQNDYLTIIAYCQQLQTRGLSTTLDAYLLYKQGYAYHKLASNRWAKKIGVERHYRNYDYLEKSKVSFETLNKKYPSSIYRVQSNRELEVINRVLKRHAMDVSDFNASIKRQ